MQALLQDTVSFLSDSVPNLGPRVIFSVLLIFSVLGCRLFVLRFMLQTVNSQTRRIKWKRNSAYASLGIILITLFPVWLPSIQSIAAFLGLFGAGILIVLKEVILNISGWFYITIRKPFDIGDRVSVGDVGGDVIDIRLMEFALIEVKTREEGGQSTGRILHLPNALVFTTPVANSSKEFSFYWNEIKIPITTKSNWKRAIDIVEATTKDVIETVSKNDTRIRRAEREYDIRYHKITPKIFVEFNHGCIILTLRHLTEPRNIRAVRDRFWREFLSRLERERKIELSHPEV